MKRKAQHPSYPGRFILNAITGIPYTFRMGSSEEDRLWKVCDVTARNGNTEPLFLYYDSPEQADQHRRTRSNEAAISAWRERQAGLVSE